MQMQPGSAFIAAITAIALVAGAPGALARPGGWGGGGWGGNRWDGPGWDRSPGIATRQRAASRDREGTIEVSRFPADDAAAQALRHGRIAVRAMAADNDELAEPHEFDTFAAAVVDQLARNGYDTATPDPTGGQITELRIRHAEIEPREAPHKPVSGEMDVGVSNRGSSYGMAIAVDLTKPLAPLISTRLEMRIRDRATNRVLWEGRADVATREGDPHWTSQQIATRLSQALFAGFPTAG